jgi:protein-L-isoaspartate(D-aspartate) O-methyltransferase
LLHYDTRSSCGADQGKSVTEQNFESMRAAMVASQLRTTDVSDPRVVAAMRAVPREMFVAPDRRALAYVDVAIPLGGDRALSAPMVLGRLLTQADLRQDDDVLLIGAATGYGAAVLAQLVASVVAVESDQDLAKVATHNVAGIAGVTVHFGDLAQGAAESGPYDVIVIDGAVEFVPDALVEQLKQSGRLVAGLIDSSVTRLALGRKTGSGLAMTSFADAAVPPLPGFATPKTFAF